MQKLLIVDGTFLAYRSYYAMAYNKAAPVLQTEQGIETNAIVGFFNTLLSLIKNYDITHLYIAFDSHIKTFRHEMYSDYKAGRQKAPNSFYTQLDLIQDLLNHLNIKNNYFNGFEADDIIAKVAKKFDNKDILIFSGDQDLNQLISYNVSIIKKVKSEFIILNNDNFLNYYDFKPSQVIDYKAMVGDNSDNFKGIAGIGPKTASSLLKEYGTLENIYENINNIKSTWANKLLEQKENAYRDKYIATLNTDFQLIIPEIDNLSLANVQLNKEGYELCDKLELKTLKRKLSYFGAN
ncbi:5'-3' exonuclease [Mycoplasma struthionis]|uniref:5'-3' exonuclease n=1 Tax=Mycoplasma struthionis TaxID=538220 RepID=A0A502M2N2_9MOLU|nr:5'-3' exonuclease H3TH domain-containing protein [Mycoplasma struthionis]TPI02400.1 5'-3' exonuclease [Mycoplasma struthionis]